MWYFISFGQCIPCPWVRSREGEKVLTEYDPMLSEIPVRFKTTPWEKIHRDTHLHQWRHYWKSTWLFKVIVLILSSFSYVLSWYFSVRNPFKFQDSPLPLMFRWNNWTTTWWFCFLGCWWSALSVNSGSQLFLVFTPPCCSVFMEVHSKHNFNLSLTSTEEKARAGQGKAMAYMQNQNLEKVLKNFEVLHFQWICLLLCVNNTLNLPETLLPHLCHERTELVLFCQLFTCYHPMTVKLDKS